MMNVILNTVGTGTQSGSVKNSVSAKDNNFKNMMDSASKPKPKPDSQNSDNGSTVQDTKTEPKDTPSAKPGKGTKKEAADTVSSNTPQKSEVDAAIAAAVLSGKMNVAELLADLDMVSFTPDLQGGTEMMANVVADQQVGLDHAVLQQEVVLDQPVVSENADQHRILLNQLSAAPKEAEATFQQTPELKQESVLPQETAKTNEPVFNEAVTNQPVKENMENKETKPITDIAPTIEKKEETKEIKTETVIAEAPKPVAEDKVVKVKVGDVIHIGKENLAEKIAEKISIHATENNNEFEVQLEPENLGKIMIKIGMQDGKVSVSMFCSNNKTMDLLSQNVKEIGALVQTNTGTQTTVDVKEKQSEFYFDQQNQNGNQQNQNNQQERDQQKNRQNQDDISDFIQQMRLGLLGFAE